MKPYIFIFFLINGLFCYAQDNYEDIEKTFNAINNLQNKANKLNYNYLNNTYHLSFSKKSFLVYLKDFTATQSRYHQVGQNPDTLVLIENIPLSKAEYVVQNPIGKLAEVVLSFPSKILEEKYYTNGKLVKTLKTDKLSFFTAIDNLEELFKLVGFLVHSIQEEKSLLAKGRAKSINVDIEKFLLLNGEVEEILTNTKKLLNKKMGIYQTLFEYLKVELENKINHYAKTDSEYKILKTRLDRELKIAAISYNNYNHYYIVDTLTAGFLKKYTTDDFRKDQYETIQKINKDAKYRHKWNLEYKNNLSKIISYEEWVKKQEYAKIKSNKAFAATLNTGAYIRTFMITFGGMSTIMGGYGKFFDKKEETFSKSTSNSLFNAGVATVGTSLLWSAIIHSKIKIRNNRLNKVNKEVTKRENEIKTILEKRLEKRNGQPIIHEQK